MPNGLKVIIAALVVVAGAGWWYTRHAAAPTVPPYTQQTPGKAAGYYPPPGQSKPQAQNPEAASIAGRSATNASLDQDLGVVDTQLKSLDADSASVDQGLNDKPVSQE